MLKRKVILLKKMKEQAVQSLLKSETIGIDGCYWSYVNTVSVTIKIIIDILFIKTEIKISILCWIVYFLVYRIVYYVFKFKRII